jgi:hypothetical protein
MWTPSRSNWPFRQRTLLPREVSCASYGSRCFCWSFRLHLVLFLRDAARQRLKGKSPNNKRSKTTYEKRKPNDKQAKRRIKTPRAPRINSGPWCAGGPARRLPGGRLRCADCQRGPLPQRVCATPSGRPLRPARKRVHRAERAGRVHWIVGKGLCLISVLLFSFFFF